MDRTIIILIMLIQFISIEISSQESYLSKNGQSHLLGETTVEQLKSQPYDQWYNTNYDNYNPKFSSHILDKLENKTVRIYIGTWCGDTKKLLPEFIKLWNMAGLSESQLEIIALHSEGNEYKRSPARTENLYDIHRVPTFVFEQDEIEIGRIVERPVTDLITDISQIALGYPTEPRYQGVTHVSQFLRSANPDHLFKELDKVQKKISRINSGPSELNTYGYVLMAAQEYASAEFVFILNTRLYPYDPNVYDSLGELYLKKNEWNEAIACYEKVLEISKDDQHALKMLEEISSLKSEN